MVPAGKRLGSWHGTSPGDQLGPSPGPPGPAGPPQRSGARGGAHPLQPHGGPPPPVRADAAPVQHCLWGAVTAAQDEPSLAPWLGPAEQHAYGSMPAAAVDKVLEHLNTTHDALARVVGRQPSPAGTDPVEEDPPESAKRLQAAVLR